MDNQGGWPENVGILAIELYIPSSYVDQNDLEIHDGVSSGKYTVGLGQEKMAFCTDREDTVSMCLTAVSSLMRRTRTNYSDVGRLEVGTESSVDKSKSIKSMLMRLFKESGNSDVEGVDSTNACYGGTAALFNSIAWLESSAWDGRLAVFVAGDVAVYAQKSQRATGGAGSIAILLGPNAPLVLDRGLRGSHMDNQYDFYKGDIHQIYPLVNGKLSIACYLEALYKCYVLYRKKFLNNRLIETNTSSESVLQHFDTVIFHAPYGKLVRKAFTWLTLHDVQLDAKCYEAYPNLLNYVNTDINIELLSNPRVVNETQLLFEKHTAQTQKLSKNIGNMYTASVFSGLISYLLSKPSCQMAGKRIGIFSFGSGLCSSMYSFTVHQGTKLDTLIGHLLEHVPILLDERYQVSANKFEETLKRHELSYNKAPFQPTASVDKLFPNSWYLTHIDDTFKRYYVQKN